MNTVSTRRDGTPGRRGCAAFEEVAHDFAVRSRASNCFWFDRWREGQIGFHEGKPNASLANAIGELGTAKRVLVPLCGKAEDLAFLASRGHTVIGCELVEDAVKQFFAEHGWTPQVTKHANHVQYTHGSISVFAGDFFAVDTALIGGPCTALLPIARHSSRCRRSCALDTRSTRSRCSSNTRRWCS
ncbi:MAG: hypothetical protein QM765_25710 [Myxococcales bacterium]